MTLITNRGREPFHMIGLTGPSASIAWVEAMKSDMFIKKTPISLSSPLFCHFLMYNVDCCCVYFITVHFRM